MHRCPIAIEADFFERHSLPVSYQSIQMKRAPLKIAAYVFLLLVATLLTQIGGIIIVLGTIAGLLVLRRWFRPAFAVIIGTALCYGMALLLVPLLAQSLGRESLPWRATDTTPLRPRNIGFCLLFRNFTTPELAELLRSTSRDFAKQHDGYQVDYLDACFPFRFGGRYTSGMLPHLSHWDGEKVDLCFVYRDRDTGGPARSPSAIGYFIYENPRAGETAHPSNLLRWDMAWLQKLGRDSQLDEARTRDLLKLFSQNSTVEKLLLEPHLKTRWGLSNDSKIRFQGLRAARHDDHIHLQVY